MNLLKKWLSPEVVVVELSSSRPSLDPNLESNIATLAHHPGFLELSKRLSLQRAVLETKLKREDHTDLAAVSKLQAGIYWLEYLDREIEHRVHKTKRPAPKPAPDDVMEEFNRIHSALTLISPTE